MKGKPRQGEVIYPEVIKQVNQLVNEIPYSAGAWRIMGLPVAKQVEGQDAVLRGQHIDPGLPHVLVKADTVNDDNKGTLRRIAG